MIKMVRNLMTTAANGHTRLYFEPSVLESAGFSPGDSVSLRLEQDAVFLVRCENGEGVISRRQRAGWKAPRPYFDRKNPDITRVLRARQRIDMIVRDGEIQVRAMTSFSLVEISDTEFQSDHLKRLRCLSIPAGAGVATAALCQSGLYESTAGVDYWNAAIDTYKLNFPDSLSLFGDVRHIAPRWIPKADVAWLSAECIDFSPLGLSGVDAVGGLGPHYTRLILASGARVVIMEQVPAYFRSRAYRQVQEILAAAGFGSFYEIAIDAHAFGSIPSRHRGYAVAFKGQVDFSWPDTPRIPDRFRSTVGQVIGPDWEERGEFKPIAGTYMEQLLARDGEHNNFTAKHNRTLVGLEDTKMAAILASYSRTNSTSSYLLHPDGKHWRKFLASELAQFLHIPDWFEFPEWMSENMQTQLIGQSVDANVVRAIGVEVAVALMKADISGNNRSRSSEHPLIQDKSGQYAFML